jgi:phosphate transport system ATP-binding protein
MVSELRILRELEAGESFESREARPAREQIRQAIEPAVSTRGLHAYYGTFLALRNVSFSAEVGQITAIIGPSGCGKSTLIRSLNRINDLIPGYHIDGQVLIGEQDIHGEDIDIPSLRRRVGMLFQRPTPFPMSIYDNVVYPLRLIQQSPRTELDEAAERFLRQTALWDEVKDRLDAMATGLSGGQQQRLCLARTLAAGSDIILMDEPCASLDPIATLHIEELMRNLRGLVTIVIVTHNLQQAARVSDYTAFMLMGRDRAGELIELGETKTLFKDPVDRRTEDYITGRFG